MIQSLQNKMYGIARLMVGDMRLQFPEQGFLKRMRIYLAEMYPIPIRLLSSALLYLSFAALLGRIHGVQIQILSPFTLVGVWSVFALGLILRLMDELKDKDIDQKLFSHRPVPAGKVFESDVWFSLVAVISLYVFANIWVPAALWMAFFLLKYSLLMFRYFFIPDTLRKYLLLNVATHNPVVPIMLTYILVLFSAEQGLSLRNLDWHHSLLTIAAFWAMFFAWEISRKIRSPEEENEYVTYSQIFGRAGAVLIAGGAQTISFVVGLYFYSQLSFSGIFLAILLLGYGVTMWGHARFLLNPNPVTSKLKPFAERYILIILFANVLEHTLFQRGWQL